MIGAVDPWSFSQDRRNNTSGSHPLLGSSVALAPAPHNSVHRAAEQRIGQQSQERGHNQGLAWIYSAEDDDFVDQIDDDRHDKDPGQLSPALLQQFAPVNRIRDDCPTVGRASGSCVPYAGTARDHSRREWLKEKSKCEWPVQPTDEILPCLSYCFVHGLSSPREM